MVSLIIQNSPPLFPVTNRLYSIPYVFNKSGPMPVGITLEHYLLTTTGLDLSSFNTTWLDSSWIDLTRLNTIRLNTIRRVAKRLDPAWLYSDSTRYDLIWPMQSDESIKIFCEKDMDLFLQCRVDSEFFRLHWRRFKTSSDSKESG
jgi:hypothetical protein